MPLHSWVTGDTRELDSGTASLLAGWTEASPGSDVMRVGNQVTIAMQVKNAAEAAYASGTTYAAGAFVTESGVTYESVAGGNVGHTPSTDAGVHWKVVEHPERVCVLPPEYRPAAATSTEDGKFNIATTGIVTSSVSRATAPSEFIPFQVCYRAATVTP